MWLGNPTFYKHYDQLTIMMNALISDYSEWRKLRSFEKAIDADERYAMPSDNKGGFKAIPLIDARRINDLEDKDLWKRSTTQFYNIPGAIDLCINMIRPGKMLPVHHDGDVWKWLQQSMGDPNLKGYTLSFGIDIPEPEKQGLKFGGEMKFWKTGEFVAFDGHDIQHSTKNESTNPEYWRVTAVMEIDIRHFNLP